MFRNILGTKDKILICDTEHTFDLVTNKFETSFKRSLGHKMYIFGWFGCNKCR